jgi:hypothetical protein
MKRLAIGLLSVVALAVPAPAFANPPAEVPIFQVFTDINPCSGETMTVTFAGTARVHEHGDRLIETAHRTITTSDGFVGRGVNSFVSNGQVEKFTLNDVLTNRATGERFRAKTVVVIDSATDTVRVERGELTCI